MEKEIVDMKRKLDDLTEEERKIDKNISELNAQIKNQFLENQELREYHYITYDDCVSICKAMNKGDSNKSMIILSAPKGASLEAIEEQNGGCMLKMDANGKG